MKSLSLINYKNSLKILLILLGLKFIASCSTDISEYKDNMPTLSLEKFFNGKLTASGIVEDYSSKVIRTFNVTMDASWNGNQGIIDENFIFSDGEIQKRIWQITAKGDGVYHGTASDIIGVAIGKAEGNALRWQYDMLLNTDGKTYRVEFDDWMFLVNDNTIINRSEIIKFGITVGKVLLVIQKQQ